MVIIKIPFGVFDPPTADEIAIKAGAEDGRLAGFRHEEPEGALGGAVEQAGEIDDVPHVFADHAVDVVLAHFFLQARNGLAMPLFGEAKRR